MAQEQFAGQIEIIGVGGSTTSEADLERFIGGYGVTDLEHVSDTDNSIWERYGVFSQPIYAFIDDDGSVEVTRLPVAELPDRIEQLLDS